MLRPSGKVRVHANDHVNLGQSSNDVIPTAIRVSAQLAVVEHLLPSLKHLRQTIDRRGRSLAKVVKTGRTHLMDAMPLTFQQEFSAWSAQLKAAEDRLQDSLKRVRRLPLGGTAIGTGINADPRFGAKVARVLSVMTKTSSNRPPTSFEAWRTGRCRRTLRQLSALAVALLRFPRPALDEFGAACRSWRNRTPHPATRQLDHAWQVNPVIPEATVMVCAQSSATYATRWPGRRATSIEREPCR